MHITNKRTYSRGNGSVSAIQHFPMNIHPLRLYTNLRDFEGKGKSLYQSAEAKTVVIFNCMFTLISSLIILFLVVYIFVVIMWFDDNVLRYPSQNISKHHNDVIKWKYFPRCWPVVRGIHLSLNKCVDDLVFVRLMGLTCCQIELHYFITTMICLYYTYPYCVLVSSISKWCVLWHDTNPWWRHQMETFSALLALVRGHLWIPRTKASDAELWCFRWSASEKNGWVNIRDARDWDAIALIMTSL